MPTMADVARRAGVAVSTVSYALSGTRPITEETRQRIFEAMAELGYHPNLLARSLVTKRTRTIALFFPAIMHRALSEAQFEFVASTANVASQRGYGLLLWTVPGEDHQLQRLIQEGLIEGVILMEIKLHDPRVEFLRASGFPFSLIGHCEENAGISFVDYDFADGVRQSVHCLAALGHHAIAFFNFPQPLLDAGFGPAVRSLEGFNTGLAETGSEGFLSASSNTPQSAADAFRTLMAKHPDITGAIVVNETICAGIYQAAYELGSRIAEDLSVIAVASKYAAEKTTPPVTTINLPAAEMGRIGAELLIDQLESSSDRATQLLLAAELVIRQSTGPCREKKGGETATSQP